MKNLLLKTTVNKIYIVVMIIITLFILGSYFSYAMFTVSKEKSNAISIVTGNLEYKLKIDGEENDTLVIDGNTIKQFVITLSNPNNRIARFNFYYEGNLPDNVKTGYINDSSTNNMPSSQGINLEKNDSSFSSNTYKIVVSNNSDDEVSIKLGVDVGLDYNDLTLPDNGHLFEEYNQSVADVLLDSNKDIYDDGVDTFIVGEEPNNYIWYSGKLWRAVSVNNEIKTAKLVTQWNISAIPYNVSSTSEFKDSYMEEWLNDTSADGFLGNLRDYDKFIVTDSIWDATEDSNTLGNITRPNGMSVVTAPVGLLNMYEYQSSNNGGTDSYLNNGLFWWTLTPYNNTSVNYINLSGANSSYSVTHAYGIRPAINLKKDVIVVEGSGTIDNPYRLKGDNDNNLSGTKLSSRYSGEYVSFGAGENNLYRIVSHESEGLTKIVSAEPLKDSSTFKTIAFGDTTSFSSTNTIGSFLNNDYLNDYVDSYYHNMIEKDSTWYLGSVGSGVSYKLAKYTNNTDNILTSNTVIATVGLLRIGELMLGQFDKYNNNTDYWPITSYNNSNMRSVYANGNINYNNPLMSYGIKPALNLKSNVIITGGDGTLQNPFTLELS